MRLTFPITRSTRADAFLLRVLPFLSHAARQKLFRKKEIKCGGKPISAEDHLTAGSELIVFIPDPREHFRYLTGCDIIIETPDLIALSKRSNLPVVPGTGLRADLRTALEILLQKSVIVVHRLDSGTSGIMLYAFTPTCARALENAFRQRKADKIYHALVSPAPTETQGDITLPLKKAGEKMLAGKGNEAGEPWLPAHTAWRVLERRAHNTALLELRPTTGRTHQIRVHCMASGMPILGDDKYGGDLMAAPRLMLHASVLTILGTTYAAPLPAEFHA